MIRKSIVLIVLLCVLLISMEFIVRAIGHRPYSLPEFSFTSQPKWCFAKDSLGVVPIPGSYVVNLNGLVHTVTHGPDSNRVTSYVQTELDNRPTIYLYGCSYSYGQGVDDDKAYPFLLQKRYSEYKVFNYSRPGYGTIQALLHLKKALKNKVAPSLVVINFATFHEERNVLARSYRYKLYMGYQMMDSDAEKMDYPKVLLAEDSIKVEYENVVNSFSPVPFRDVSALLNMVDLALNFSGSEEMIALASTKVIVHEINQLCTQHDIRLVIADVDASPNSEIMERYCATIGVPFVNISPDFSSDGFRNLPHDNHPNARAHEVYVSKMADFLSNELMAQ